jgi:caa(3)-type oxidase subunit IV
MTDNQNQTPPIDPSPVEPGSVAGVVGEVASKVGDMIADPATALEKQMPTAPISPELDPLKGLDPVHHADVMPAHTASLTGGHAVGTSGEPHAAHAETLAPTSTFLGRSFPMPLYTTIYAVLVVLTAIEVAITIVLPKSLFLTPLLLVIISLIKAVLVVAYYMHLREDSRLFALALLLPVFIGLVSTLFLLSVPTTGYGDQVF